jgi:hypothetical protein
VPRSSPSSRELLAALVATSAAVAAPHAPAAEPEPPPTDVPGIGQYVEEIPAATGPIQKGAKTTEPSRKIPSPIRERLRRSGGPDAAVLEEIASSPSLAAPHSTRTASRPTASESPNPRSGPSAPVAAARAVAGGDGHLTLLLLGLAAITAALILLRVYRRND